MLIEVTPSHSDSFFNISNNVTTLLAAVNGSELGLRGNHHMFMYNVLSLEMMNIYKEFFFENAIRSIQSGYCYVQTIMPVPISSKF